MRDPITVTPDMSVLQIMELAQDAGVSGFPVVQNKKWLALSPIAICVLNYTAKAQPTIVPTNNVDAKIADNNFFVFIMNTPPLN